MLNKKLIFNLIHKLGFVTFGKIISFIAIPIVSRALGPESFGIYNYAIAIAGYAFLPANWGFLAKGIRDVAKSPKDAISIIEKITSGRVALWLLGGCSLILGAALFGNKDQLLYITIAIIINLGTALSIDYYYYGKKQTFLPSLSAFLGQLAFLLALLFFKDIISSIVVVLILNFVAKLIEAVILLIPIYKEKYIKINIFNFSDGINLLKGNFLLGLGSKAGFFVSTLPIIIIPMYLTSKDLGIFSASFKLFLVITMLLQSINLVFSPWIVDSRNKSIKVRKQLFHKLILLYTIIGIACAGVSYLTGDFMIDHLFGIEYEQTKELFKLFSLYIIPFWPLYMVLTSYMNNFEKDNTFFIGTIIQLMFLLVTLPLGISFFGLNGAIYAIGVSTLFPAAYYAAKLKPMFLESTDIK